VSGLKIISIIGNGLKAQVIINVGIGKNIYFPLTHVIFNSIGTQISTIPIKAKEATNTPLTIAAIHISHPTVHISGIMTTTRGRMDTIIHNNDLVVYTHQTSYSGSNKILYLKVWRTRIPFGLLHAIFLGLAE
jgi:hypothetical protein